MSRTDKYIAPFFVGGAGMLFLVSPLFINLGYKMPAYIASQELQSQQERERQELSERKKTSDKLSQSGLVRTGATLTLRDYLDDPSNLPRLRKTDLNRYATTQAWIYDASDRCIGRVVKGRFISKHKSKTACEEAPNGN